MKIIVGIALRAVKKNDKGVLHIQLHDNRFVFMRRNIRTRTDDDALLPLRVRIEQQQIRYVPAGHISDNES